LENGFITTSSLHGRKSTTKDSSREKPSFGKEPPWRAIRLSDMKNDRNEKYPIVMVIENW
jgi:hypothetical protein